MQGMDPNPTERTQRAKLNTRVVRLAIARHQVERTHPRVDSGQNPLNSVRSSADNIDLACCIGDGGVPDVDSML